MGYTQWFKFSLSVLLFADVSRSMIATIPSQASWLMLFSMVFSEGQGWKRQPCIKIVSTSRSQGTKETVTSILYCTSSKRGVNLRVLPVIVRRYWLLLTLIPQGVFGQPPWECVCPSRYPYKYSKGSFRSLCKICSRFGPQTKVHGVLQPSGLVVEESGRFSGISATDPVAVLTQSLSISREPTKCSSRNPTFDHRGDVPKAKHLLLNRILLAVLFGIAWSQSTDNNILQVFGADAGKLQAGAKTRTAHHDEFLTCQSTSHCFRGSITTATVPLRPA